MKFSDGTLNGVANAITYEGAMNVTSSGSTYVIISGNTSGNDASTYLTVTGAGGTGTGTINIGTNNDVYFFDSQTFGATSFVTIDLEGNNATLGADPSVGTAGTLVLGADVTVEQTLGAIGYLSNGSSTHAAATLINDGAIDAEDTTSGATLNIESTGNNTFSFTNNGSIVHRRCRHARYRGDRIHQYRLDHDRERHDCRVQYLDQYGELVEQRDRHDRQRRNARSGRAYDGEPRRLHRSGGGTVVLENGTLNMPGDAVGRLRRHVQPAYARRSAEPLQAAPSAMPATAYCSKTAH